MSRFSKMEELDLSHRGLTELPHIPDTVRVLNCESNKLVSLPRLPDGLKELICFRNKLTSLPTLPPGLVELNCYYNNLTAIPTLPETLTHLNYSENDVRSLPPLPLGLLKLECDSNKITVLPSLPPGLIELSCGFNNLITIPTLPETLEDLYCVKNNITSLPPLPLGLLKLECGDNKITILPSLPPGLLELGCGKNKITVLPSLPPGLIELKCVDNNLTEIPPLPERLEVLTCGNNKFISLPPLPPNLKALTANYNFLKTIPELPESLIILQISNNKLDEPYKTFYREYEQSINDADDNADDEEVDNDPNRIPNAIKVLREKIHSYLNREGNKELWKGFTRSDISKLDVIFGEKADDYAMCPVCLRYVQREDGCMYMKHNCTSIPGYYHKKLYDIYKTPEGNICWCTICGRIALGHRHYKLRFQDIPENITLDYLRELRSSLLDGGNPFDKDCHWTNGGGSLIEKLQRFRRYREYALALQHEIDQITAEDALDQLVEEVWNAPMRREKRAISKMRAEKKWNIPENAFPPNAAPANNRNSNAPNVPFDGEMPTKVDKGTNVVMMNDDVPVIEFHHRQKNGDMENHGVAESTLEGFIQNTSPTDDAFGYCFAQPACNAKLHPEEVKPYVSEAIYKRYKKHFNIKFKAMSGGATNNIVQEATDAMCVVVKRGGRTRSKRRTKRSKTRRHAKTRHR